MDKGEYCQKNCGSNEKKENGKQTNEVNKNFNQFNEKKKENKSSNSTSRNFKVTEIDQLINNDINATISEDKYLKSLSKEQFAKLNPLLIEIQHRKKKSNYSDYENFSRIEKFLWTKFFEESYFDDELIREFLDNLDDELKQEMMVISDNNIYLLGQNSLLRQTFISAIKKKYIHYLENITDFGIPEYLTWDLSSHFDNLLDNIIWDESTTQEKEMIHEQMIWEDSSKSQDNSKDDKGLGSTSKIVKDIKEIMNRNLYNCKISITNDSKCEKSIDPGKKTHKSYNIFDFVKEREGWEQIFDRMLNESKDEDLKPFDEMKYERKINHQKLINAIFFQMLNCKKEFLQDQSFKKEFGDVISYFIENADCRELQAQFQKEKEHYFSNDISTEEIKKNSEKALKDFKEEMLNLSDYDNVYTLYSILLCLFRVKKNKEQDENNLIILDYSSIKREISREILEKFEKSIFPSRMFRTIYLYIFENALGKFKIKESKSNENNQNELAICKRISICKTYEDMKPLEGEKIWEMIQKFQNQDKNFFKKEIEERIKSVNSNPSYKSKQKEKQKNPKKFFKKLLKNISFKRENKNVSSKHTIVFVPGYLKMYTHFQKEWDGVLSSFPYSQIFKFQWSGERLERYSKILSANPKDYNCKSPKFFFKRRVKDFFRYYFIKFFFKIIIDNLCIFLLGRKYLTFNKPEFSQIIDMHLSPNQYKLYSRIIGNENKKNINETQNKTKIAGAILAAILAKHTDFQYESISLISFSYGVDVVNEALSILNKHGFKNLIHDVYFLAGITTIDKIKEENYVNLVTGKIYNIYSENDDILSSYNKRGLFSSPLIGIYGLFPQSNHKGNHESILLKEKRIINQKCSLLHIQYRKNFSKIMMKLFSRIKP